jgi:hypothetical protein
LRLFNVGRHLHLVISLCAGAPNNFVDLIALPVLAASFDNASFLALNGHWLDALHPARLQNKYWMTRLPDVLQRAHCNEML